MKPMLVIGGFAFTLAKDSEYEKLSRVFESGWQEVARVGAKPLLFNKSPKLNSITISGTWVKKAGPKHVDEVVKMMDKPQVMSNSEGVNLGRVVIMRFKSDESNHLYDGSPQLTAFTMELKEYVNDDNQSA